MTLLTTSTVATGNYVVVPTITSSNLVSNTWINGGYDIGYATASTLDNYARQQQWFTYDLTTTTWTTTTSSSIPYVQAVNTLSRWQYQQQEFPLPEIVPAAIGTSTITVGATWSAWNEEYYRELAARVVVPMPPQQPQAVPPLIARVEEVNRAQEKRRQAQKTARATLLSLLDGSQREQLERESCFELRVDDRLYQIRPGNVVYRLDPATRKKLSHFCIHPVSSELPEDDWAIAQKLLLEADEGLFLRTANRRDYA